MSGPLHILRQWITDGKTIDESDPTCIQCDGIKLDLQQETEYLSKRGKDKPYNLDTVWFSYKNSTVSHTDYIKACNRENHDSVVYSDRNELSEWLQSKRERTSGIIEEEPAKPEPQTESTSIPTYQTTSIKESTIEEEIPVKEAETDLPIAREDIQDDKGPIVKYETIRSIDSVLLCPYQFQDMLQKCDIFQTRDQARKKGSKDESFVPDLVTSKDESFIDEKQTPSGNFQNYIILVSRSNKCRINNTNIEQFLTGNEWTEPTRNDEKKHFQIKHRHTMNMKTYKYDVVADEKQLNDDDWKRVVAIFVTGMAWQIKYFPSSINYNQAPTLFSKVAGIYVGWDNESIPSDIANWSVKKFKINKAKRHGDPQIVSTIWREIEEATAQLKKRSTRNT